MTVRQTLMLVLPLLVLEGCFGVGAFRVQKKLTPISMQPLLTASKQARQLEAEAAKRYKHARYPGLLLEASDRVEQPGGLSGWYEHHFQTRRYLVLDAESSAVSTFALLLGRHEELVAAEIVVASVDGEVHRLSNKDFVETPKPGGRLLYKVALPGIDRGAVVEIRTHRREVHLPGEAVRHQIALHLSLPCLRRDITYAYPEGWEVQIRKLGPGKDVPLQSARNNGLVELRYLAANLPAADKLPYAPVGDADLPHLDIRVAYHRVGTTFVRKPNHWGGLIPRLERALIAYDLHGTGEARDLGARWTAGIATRDEGAILGAVVAGIQRMFEADRQAPATSYREMFLQRRGSPLLLTAFTRLVLEEAGVRATLVMISPAVHGYFDPNYISTSQLYAPALRVDVGKRELWAFPYLPGYAVGHIPPQLQGRKALAVTIAEDPKQFVTPVLPTSLDVKELYYLLRPDPATGRVSVTEERALHGLAAYPLKQRLDRLGKHEQQRALQRMHGYTDGAITLRSAERSKQLSSSDPLVITLRYDIKNLLSSVGDVASGEKFLQLDGLLTTLSRWARLGNERNARNRPVQILGNSKSVGSVEIEIPDGWKVHGSIKPARFENRFGVARRTVTRPSPERLRISCELLLNKGEHPASTITELAALSDAAARQARLPPVLLRASK